MKERAPSVQFYFRQFSGDEHVAAMDLDAVGAHMLLICAAGASKLAHKLPADDDLLRGLLKNPRQKSWEKIKAQLLKGAWKLSPDGKWWIQSGLRRSFAKQKAYRDRQADVARRRWGSSEISGNSTRAERLSAARQKGRHTREDFYRILELCEWKCGKCGSPDGLVRDHITPLYRGGSDGVENLQPLCRKCNAAKGQESIDYRQKHVLEALGINACRTPAERLPAQAYPSSSSSSSKDLSTDAKRPRRSKNPAEQKRNVEAQLNRKAKEESVLREAQVGTGPDPRAVGAVVKAAAREHRMPQQHMSAEQIEQRRQELKRQADEILSKSAQPAVKEA